MSAPVPPARRHYCRVSSADRVVGVVAIVFALLCAVVILSSCASGPLTLSQQWGRTQAGYNVVLAQLVEMRQPCKEYGPDDPGCLISDEAYRRIETVRASADLALKSADAAIQAGDDDAARTALAAVEAATQQLIDLRLQALREAQRNGG